MSTSLLLLAALGALFVIPACADDLEPNHDTPDAAPTDPDAIANPDTPAATGPFATTRHADGSYITTVDAQALDTWTYGDFETGAAVDESAAWDLRFERFHLSTNGGVSGPGGVEIAVITGTAFDAVTTAPTTGWLADADDGDDPNTVPDYAFEQGDGWYDYDATAHVLTPKPLVYVVKTTGGSTLKLEILKYYDDAGTAAVFTLHWRPL